MEGSIKIENEKLRERQETHTRHWDWLEWLKSWGRCWQKPTFIPLVPGFVLKTLMGEFGSVPREGQKVLPGRLLDNMEDILMNLK